MTVGVAAGKCCHAGPEFLIPALSLVLLQLAVWSGSKRDWRQIRGEKSQLSRW